MCFSLIPGDATVQGSYVVPRHGEWGWSKVIYFQFLRTYQLLLSPLPTWVLSGAIVFSNVSAILGAQNFVKVTCWSIYLDSTHSPSSLESSSQPNVAPGSLCWLTSQRALFAPPPPNPKHQGEGSEEEKNLFF